MDISYIVQKVQVLLNDRPRPISRKIREGGVKNRRCLSDVGASYDDLAVRTLIFRAKRAQS